tara:strand:- start:669 stop:893 length:225 start_codon:yes stop_codon:yes gene_type:complete
MANSASTEKKPSLNFDGESYDIESLNKETKDLLRSIQVADTQVKMHQDTLRLVIAGRQVMVTQLKDKLKDVKPK